MGGKKGLIVVILSVLLLVTSCQQQDNVALINKNEEKAIVSANQPQSESTETNSASTSREAISVNNWLTHPDIIDVREIYNETEKLITTNKAVKKDKSKEYGEPYVPTYKAVFSDTNGKVRKYVEEAGSDDSALVKNYYYDSKGVLRFIFIIGGAVNGTVIEHRIYFNSEGNKIWEIQKQKEGPGYTFPKVWPSDDYVKDPLEKYEAEE